MAISIPHHAEPVRLRSGRALAFVAGASAFVVLALAFALSRSSLFALRSVEIRGASHRSPAEIHALADVPDGTNVVWLDTSAVAARLLSDPWVERATVTRELPWSLSITIEERTPVAVVEDGRARTLVADDGTRLGPAPADARLPRISLPPAAPATVGPPGEAGAVRAIAAMAPSVRHRLREVDVLVGGTLILRLTRGATVDLGPSVDLEAEARALRRVLAWEETTGTPLARVSLIAPSAPAAELQS